MRLAKNETTSLGMGGRRTRIVNEGKHRIDSAARASHTKYARKCVLDMK